MKRKLITDMKYLRQLSKPVLISQVEKYKEERKTLEEVIRDLEDTLKELKTGIGLTAIQIGIPLQAAIIRIGNKKIDLINPKILEREDRIRYRGEVCLSLPGITVDTARHDCITFENNGKRYGAEGLEAVCIQHEVDHLNGILITDRKWRKRR